MNRVGLPLVPVSVELDGAVLSEPERASLGGIRVNQRLSLPAQAELTFDHEPPAELAERLVPGTALRIAAGAESPSLFAGEITAVEYVYAANQGRQVRVRGYDRLHRLRKRQPVRARVQVGLVELAQELAGGLGLAVSAPPVSLSWRRLIQHGQDDLEFFARLADAAGLYFVLWDSTLHLLTLEGIGEPVRLRLGEDLLEARIELNGDPACRAVAADGWDPLRAEVHSGRASEPRLGRPVAAEVAPGRVGGTGECRLVEQAVESLAQAEALAQSELDRRRAREVVLRGVAEGDSRLRPGARVEVSGVARAVEGGYVLTEVTHRLGGQQQFISEISTALTARSPRLGGASVVMGRVSAVDDPEGLGRVQVELPAAQGVETDWMEVLAPGGGKKKGLVMVPEVGDTVVVLCAQEDPARGVVLGGLFGTGGPPDAGVEGRSVQRFTFRSASGHQLQLDDARQRVRLENAAGSYVELGPDRSVVHSAVDLDLEAPGRAIVVRAASIDFERH